ncbi:putative oxidoreductase C-terminal domain-containing protein [Maribacter sp. 2307ULW6-5]|uniref:putative oxidoreductase C-terminal domain-containing protein n=1 Tax=Maribacter sp. 2307ULW6-5 TaxID=3386275 RepID=UPI0039BD221F
MEKNPAKVQLMVLDPGHFHAALVHKTMYPEVDSTIYLYAPKGREAQDFLDRVKGYNTRPDAPTQWKVVPHYSNSFLDVMLAQGPGNVMIVAGKNSKKIDYILEAVKAGFNVYADKPLVINDKGFDKLKEAFRVAGDKGVLIYDIMTERFEATSRMQQLLGTLPSVFGHMEKGSVEEPAISKESVHHFYKFVSGKPLVRPPWFFDVDEEGDGLVDVTTHLVDLIQWGAFPGEVVDTAQVVMLGAKRWPTVLSQKEFSEVTGLDAFPNQLQKDVVNDRLHVFCNGEMNYTINGKHAKVSVRWAFRAPEGTGDTHYSIMRGSKSHLIIEQGANEDYKPVLYVESQGSPNFEKELQRAMGNEVSTLFPGTTVTKMVEGRWRVNIPDDFRVGHEAHFAQVTENFLDYMEAGRLPDGEVANMIAKYHTIMAAYKMAQNRSKK